MKRDMELVRQVLLKVEAEGTTPMDWIDDYSMPGYEDDLVSYHVWLLAQAGFMEAIDGSTMEGFQCNPRCLTWSGAELLDSIRDPEIWRQTKDGLKKAGGAGVEVLWELAKAVTKAKLSAVTGLPLA